jgi:hypothetical protein
MSNQLNKTLNILQTAYRQGYEPKRRTSGDGKSHIWRWEDLFTPEGKSSLAWQVEFFAFLFGEFTRVAFDPSYKNGLLINAKPIGPDNPSDLSELSWWGLWDVERLQGYYSDYEKQGHNDYGKTGLGEMAIAAHAIKQAEELYDHFADMQGQDGLIIQVLDNIVDE